MSLTVRIEIALYDNVPLHVANVLDDLLDRVCIDFWAETRVITMTETHAIVELIEPRKAPTLCAESDYLTRTAHSYYEGYIKYIVIPNEPQTVQTPLVAKLASTVRKLWMNMPMPIFA